jgi:hypothetical protein
MDNKEFIDILDKMLRQALPEQWFANYVFYCSIDFKCEIINYKGFEVVYTNMVKENNICFAKKIHL